MNARIASSASPVQPDGSAPSRKLIQLPRRQGAFWVILALAVPRVAGAVFTIALRRFLGPGMSGTFDLAYAPYRFFDNFRNFGTGPALVYEQSVNREVADTAWTMNMIAAVLVTALIQLLAGPIARYFGHPAIEGVLRILSIAYIFASAASVHYFLLLRNMDFRTRSVVPIGQVIAAGVAALLLAMWGFGIGSLVGRELASVAAGAVILWAVYPFRPRPRLIPHVAGRLFRYGAWIGGGLTLLYLSQNADVLIAGRIIHNAAEIGFYTTSWSLAFIAAGVLAVTASSMVFPALSRRRNDPGDLRATLLKAVRQLGLVMLPAAALLAAVAPVAIVPVLGAKWAAFRPSFLVLSILAVYAGNRTMLAIFFEGYKAVGKPWLVPVYNAVKLALLVPAMIYGAHHGILGLAVMYIPLQLVEIPVALALADRVLAVSPRALWQAARAPILATCLMTTGVIGIELLLHVRLHAGDTATLLACIAAAGLLYPGTLFLFDRRILLEHRDLIVNGL